MRAAVWLAVALSGALALASCGEDAGNGAADAGPSCNATIGSEGGRIDCEGMSLSIPANALSEAVNFKVAVSESGAPEIADRVRVSRVYQVTPERQTFTVGATVTLPYDKTKLPAGIDERAVDLRRTDSSRQQERLNAVNVNQGLTTVNAEAFSLGIFWATVPAGPRPAIIKVTPAQKVVTKGQTVQYTAEVRDQSGLLMPGEPVTWSTSDAKVATIDAAGLATATGPGTTDVIARAGSAQGRATLQVAGTDPFAQSFAWENPTPQGNTLWGVKGDATRLLVAGGNGTLMQRGGSGWQQLSSAPSATFFDAAFTPGGAVAVGVAEDQGLVASWDAAKGQATVKLFPAALPTAVYADANKGMAVGGGTDILVMDPATSGWTNIPSPVSETLLAVDGAAGDLRVVGARGAVYRYSNNAWIAEHDVNTTLSQLQVDAAIAGTEAWAISATNLRHFANGQWTLVSLPSTPALVLTTVAVVADTIAVAGYEKATPSNVWVLLGQNGPPFAAKKVGSELVHGLWGKSATDVYAVGEHGFIAHYDGTAWTAQRQGSTAPVVDVAAFAGPNVFALTNECSDASCFTHKSTVLKRGSASPFGFSPMTTNFAMGMNAIGGTGPSDLWAVGEFGYAYHFTGSTWSQQFMGADLFDVAACMGTTFVSGTGVVYADSGGQLIQVLNAGGQVKLYGISCAGDVIHVVGENAIVRIENGKQPVALDPTQQNLSPATFRAVYTSPEGHAFMGGDARFILHYDGSKFEAFDRPAGLNVASVRAMWGSGLGDVYAVGALQGGGAGFVIHFNGAYWEPVDAGFEGSLNAIAGYKTGELWIGGANGAVLKGVVPAMP